jgi:sec-independent protein translocase protein TatB
MFDIGFAELLVCAIVALLVLGPERLPGTVRTVGRWIGRARHTVNQFTDQIDREIRADELKRRIDEEMKKVGVNDVTRQVNEALNAPLKTPLIGADHLRETATDNRIAPPAPVQAAVDDHADVAPALQARRTAGQPVDDGDDPDDEPPRSAAVPAAVPASAAPAEPGIAPVTAASAQPSPNAQGNSPA